MALKNFNPTTPSRRSLVLVDKKINPKLYYLLLPPMFVEGLLGES